MIRTLQKRFILTSMVAITILLVFLVSGINIVNGIIVRQDIRQNLSLIAQNEDRAPLFSEQAPEPEPEQKPKDPPPGALMPRDENDRLLSSTFFTVRFSDDDTPESIDVSHVASVDEADAKTMAVKALESGNDSGTMGQYHYMITERKTAVFLDVSDYRRSVGIVLLVSAGIALLCLLLMLFPVLLLSKKAIAPIAENMEKQKKFVTDAGHEIKTPLAIIQANTEAMEMIGGETKWSKNIKEQTVRLDGLMKNLLLLAKMEELPQKASRNNQVADLSQLLQKETALFEASFKLKRIRLIDRSVTGVKAACDPEQLRQIIAVLTDNAVKYTNEGGEVSVRAFIEDKRAVLEVKNTVEFLPNDPPDKLFDRFYRADTARTQKTGGCGIGLSIAKAMAEANRGSISAAYDTKEKAVIFTVRLKTE